MLGVDRDTLGASVQLTQRQSTNTTPQLTPTLHPMLAAAPRSTAVVFSTPAIGQQPAATANTGAADRATANAGAE